MITYAFLFIEDKFYLSKAIIIMIIKLQKYSVKVLKGNVFGKVIFNH